MIQKTLKEVRAEKEVRQMEEIVKIDRVICGQVNFRDADRVDGKGYAVALDSKVLLNEYYDTIK